MAAITIFLLTDILKSGFYFLQFKQWNVNHFPENDKFHDKNKFDFGNFCERQAIFEALLKI